MKIIHKDYKKNSLKLKIENLDDLWYLTYIIEKSDILKAKTYRKIRLSKEDERNKKSVKKPVFLAIEVNKVEFSRYSNVLRVSGKIVEGPEDMPLGSHHTISLEENSVFSLVKKKILNYQIEKLEEAAKGNKAKILVVVHDQEKACFAIIKNYGIEMLSEIKVNAKKKADLTAESAEIFPLIKKKIEEYDNKYSFASIIVASPGFWREYMQKLLKENKKVAYSACSSVSLNGINEVIKRREILEALKQHRLGLEIKKVEELLKEISMDGKADYGLRNVKKLSSIGAVSELLVTDSLIHKKRAENSFEELDNIMKKVESMKGKVHIIEGSHEGGKKLDGLGGIAALLRYKV